MKIFKIFIIKVLGIFTWIFGCGFVLHTIIKLELEQKTDLDVETKRKIFAFADTLANGMARNFRYSLSLVFCSYMFSVLVLRDYFTWANPLLVIGFLFFSGIMVSVLNFKIEGLKEALENKDEDKQN